MRSRPTRRQTSSKTRVSRRAPADFSEHAEPKTRAKVFWTGRSQAVRLPKEFRFDTESVVIRREGNKVILEPDNDWPPGYFEWLLTGPVTKLEARQLVPSRKGPGRIRDPFQVPVDDGSSRTMNVFELLAARERKQQRKRR